MDGEQGVSRAVAVIQRWSVAGAAACDDSGWSAPVALVVCVLVVDTGVVVLCGILVLPGWALASQQGGWD